MFGNRLTPQRFAALLDEFRQNITHERLVARLSEVKQDELIELVKIHAEVKARYLLAVLDLVQPNVATIDGKVEEAKRYRVMAEEIETGVNAILAAVLAKEIEVSGLDYRDDFSPEIQEALEAFMASTDEDLDKRAP